jgi:hypothetical protein
MSYSNWSLQIDADRIAWLTCDMAEASTNVLSAGVLRELALMLAEITALRPAWWCNPGSPMASSPAPTSRNS